MRARTPRRRKEKTCRGATPARGKQSRPGKTPGRQSLLEAAGAARGRGSPSPHPPTLSPRGLDACSGIGQALQRQRLLLHQLIAGGLHLGGGGRVDGEALRVERVVVGVRLRFGWGGLGGVRVCVFEEGGWGVGEGAAAGGDSCTARMARGVCAERVGAAGRGSCMRRPGGSSLGRSAAAGASQRAATLSAAARVVPVAAVPTGCPPCAT